MENKTHYKSLFNPNYLGGYSFNPGEELVATISSVAVETVVGVGGKKEDCTVIRFAEDMKPLIMNKTNGKSISKVAGSPYTEDWAGVKIQMYFDPSVKFGKETTGGIRVRETAPREERYVCRNCGTVIEDFNGTKARVVAEHTRKAYGKVLCPECATKAKAEKEAKEKEADVL